VTFFGENFHQYSIDNFKIAAKEAFQMSTHTPSTEKVTPLPDSMKVSQAIAMLEDMQIEARFITKQLRELNNEQRAMINRMNKLRLMLEAK
jgi:hypothetical protein